MSKKINNLLKISQVTGSNMTDNNDFFQMRPFTHTVNSIIGPIF